MNAYNSTSYDFSSYVYITNIINEIPLNQVSRTELEGIIETELENVEKYRFEEDGELWTTAIVKFGGKASADIAIRKLNAYERLDAAAISPLLDNYLLLENKLKCYMSDYCTFSIITVEQIGTHLNQKQLMSLFSKYGIIKITSTSPPICIGYEKLSEALAAKIDQNKWNNDDSYISVKVVSRLKEYVLGFLSVRDSYPLGFNNQMFSGFPPLCTSCSKVLQLEHSYETEQTVGSEFYYSDPVNDQPQENFHSEDNTEVNSSQNVENTPGSELGLNFNPDEFFFYLLVSKTAVKNSGQEISATLLNGSRDKETETDSGIETQDIQTGHVKFISFDPKTVFVPRVPNGVHSGFEDPKLHTFGATEERESSTNFDNEAFVQATLPVNPVDKNSSGYLDGCSVLPDDSSYQIQANSAPESSRIDDCMGIANGGTFAAERNSELDEINVGHSGVSSDTKDAVCPEIERNFELYGMKVKGGPKQQPNPRIIFVPFVYYSENDGQLQAEYSGKQSIKSEIKAKIPTNLSTRAKKSCKVNGGSKSKSGSEMPVFNDTNFPPLQGEMCSTSTLECSSKLERGRQNTKISDSSSTSSNNVRIYTRERGRSKISENAHKRERGRSKVVENRTCRSGDSTSSSGRETDSSTMQPAVQQYTSRDPRQHSGKLKPTSQVIKLEFPNRHRYPRRSDSELQARNAPQTGVRKQNPGTDGRSRDFRNPARLTNGGSRDRSKHSQANRKSARHKACKNVA